MCSGRVNSSCSTSGTRRVNLVINQVNAETLVTGWMVLLGTNSFSYLVDGTLGD